jgi:hypothetical protein
MCVYNALKIFKNLIEIANRDREILNFSGNFSIQAEFTRSGSKPLAAKSSPEPVDN